jgi:hypothetical protein
VTVLRFSQIRTLFSLVADKSRDLRVRSWTEPNTPRAMPKRKERLHSIAYFTFANDDCYRSIPIDFGLKNPAACIGGTNCGSSFLGIMTQ